MLVGKRIKANIVTRPAGRWLLCCRNSCNLNWSLNPFCYASRSVKEAFVKTVCIGVLVVASLAGCTAPLSQPEVLHAPAPDPLILPPASLLRVNQG
jgi:hypothetical protein